MERDLLIFNVISVKRWTLFKRMSKFASLAYHKKCGLFYLKVFHRGEGQNLSTFNWTNERRVRKGFDGFGKELQNSWGCGWCHGLN
jgi:hypothetical protein